MKNIFKFFSKKGKAASFGIEDATLEVDDLINMLKRTELIDGKNLKLKDIIFSIEKYYSPEQKLEYKLSDQRFQAYLKSG